MNYIATLRTNILGGTEAIALAPRTYVVGRNGKGKTRITVALGLLTSGTADDILGKDAPVRSSGELLTLAPYADERLSVEGELVLDGVPQPISFTIDGSGGTARHPQEQRPAGVNEWSLPVRLVGQALWGGPKAARDFFSRFLSPPLSAADIARRILEEYHNPEPLQGRMPQTLEDLHEFHALATGYARQEAEAERSFLRISASVGNTLPPEPTDAQIAQADAELSAAQSILQTASAYFEGQKTHQRIGALRAQAAGLEAAIRQAEAAPAQIPSPPAAHIQALASLAQKAVVVLREWMPFADPTCPCCGSPQTPELRQQKIQEMEHISNVIQAQYAGYYSALQAYELGQRQLAEARNLLAQCNAQIESLTGLVSTHLSTPTHTVEQARALCQEKYQQRQHLENARASYVAVRDATSKAILAKRMTAWWKEYAEVLRKVIQTVMALGAQDFCARVQNYLPEEFRFGLSLSDGGRESFRVGLERANGVHFALSGAEKTLVEFALAAACLDLLPEALRPKYAVFCPWEERAIDPEHGAMLMRALNALPYQVVLYSIVAPGGKPPKGWVVLELEPTAKKTRKTRGASEETPTETTETTGTTEPPAETAETPTGTTETLAEPEPPAASIEVQSAPAQSAPVEVQSAPAEVQSEAPATAPDPSTVEETGLAAMMTAMMAQLRAT